METTLVLSSLRLPALGKPVLVFRDNSGTGREARLVPVRIHNTRNIVGRYIWRFSDSSLPTQVTTATFWMELPNASE